MVLKKWIFPIIVLLFMILLYFYSIELGQKAFDLTLYSLGEALSILPPVFILLGLLDVWVSKDKMIKLMGENSGTKGVLLSFIIGSAAAGPLYGAFPIAAVLMRKGASFFNVIVFIGAWSTTKIPMFMFEMTSLGARFAISRLAIDIVGILVIAAIFQKLLTKEDLIEIYEKAETL